MFRTLRTLLALPLLCVGLPRLSAQQEGRADFVGFQPSDPSIKTIRIKFHVVETQRFSDSNSPHYVTNEGKAENINALIGAINSTYQFSNIRFDLSGIQNVTPDDQSLLAIDSTDEKRELMDLAISSDDALHHLNIVVVPIRNLGFDGHATFPWSRRSLRQGSGILISDEFVFPFSNGLTDAEVAAHEIGHALGLWHVERGVDYHEIEGLTDKELLVTNPNHPTDDPSRGDFCADTPLIPRKGELDLKYQIYLIEDPDLDAPAQYGVNWLESPLPDWTADQIGNLMRSSGQRMFLSPGQTKRMHAWIEHRLRSWVKTDSGTPVEGVFVEPIYDVAAGHKPGVKLEWKGPANSSLPFVIERSESPNFPANEQNKPPVTVSLSPTIQNTGSQSAHPYRTGNYQSFSCQDYSIENGKTYWYRVGVSGQENSFCYSPRISIRGAGARTVNARPSFIPAPHRIVSVPGGVLAEWEDPADDEISGYELRRWSGDSETIVFPKVAPGTSRFASVFDETPLQDQAEYGYQIISYYGVGDNRIHSGNAYDGPQQAANHTYSKTPKPLQPVLSFTKAVINGTFKGTITASFRGKTPSPTTVGGEIKPNVQLKSDDSVGWEPVSSAQTLNGGQQSPVIGVKSDLPTGKNYYCRIQLNETIQLAGGGSSSKTHGGSNTWSDAMYIRIPGKTTTAPVHGFPVAGENGTWPYPTFSWSPVQDAEFYDIVIRGPNYDNATIRVPASQTTYSLTSNYPELDALTEYSWRVRAGNDEGLGPLSAKRFFTTQLHAPNLVSPANGETINAPADSYTTNPTFTWGGIPGNIRFRLLVKSTGGTTLIEKKLSGGAFTATPEMDLALSSGTYTWQITAYPSGGDPDTEPRSVSETRTFIIRSKPVLGPTQILPADGAEGRTSRPTFVWEPRPQATDYVIDIVRANDWENSSWRFGGTTADNLLGTQLTGTPWPDDPAKLHFRFPDHLAGLPGARNYLWRIRARNEIGGSPWSGKNSGAEAANPDSVSNWRDEWFSFTTGLDAPVLVGPANGATIGDSSPTLSWTPAPGAVSSEVQVFLNSISGQQVAFTTVTGDSWNMPLATNELTDGSYVWRVRSQGPDNNGDPVVSAWTSAAFTLLTPPRNPPVPTNPSEGEYNRGITPNFQWDGVSKATNYRIEIRTGSTTVFSQSGIVGIGNPLTYTLPAGNALAYATEYQWRIAGVSTVGQGPFSGWVGFLTKLANTAPDTPASGSLVTDRTPILRAIAVNGASHYDFEVRKSSNTEPLYTSGSSVTDSRAWTATPDLANGTYYWRVRAAGPPNGLNKGDWSAYSWFLVQGEPTNAPNPLSPINNATNQSRRPNFTWSALNLATSYDLQVVDSHGGVIVVNQQQIGATSYKIPNSSPALTANRSYFWRVRGRNSSGTGPWSAATGIWSEYMKFTTTP